MTRFSVAILGLLALAACAPKSALPREVREDIAKATKGVREPPRAETLAQRVDVTGSGDDWLVDYERAPAAGWCGTGGCTRALYVAEGGRHVKVFDEQVREWRLTAGRPATLDIEIHGSNCDLTGVEECRRRFVWDAAAGRFSERPNEKGDGYLAGPLFQPVAPSQARVPPEVSAELQRRQAPCAALGGTVGGRDSEAISSPDLNGDGVRDGIVGSRYVYCELPGDGQDTTPPMGLAVFVSGGDHWRLALRAPEDGYTVDVGVTPARFGVRTVEDCSNGSMCPTRWYGWDGGKLAAR